MPEERVIVGAKPWSPRKSGEMVREVLIVDDSATIRQMVKKTMAMAGLDVRDI